MSDQGQDDRDPAPAKAAPYEPPRILWEDRLEQGTGIFAQCAKLATDGGVCSPMPGS